jgi:predicted transcriptional regulator
LAKHRHRVDIIADILRIAAEGARKTRIMYVANLSYSILDKYLEETTDLGFVQAGMNRYEITEKGRTFLEKYTEFSSKYSSVERLIECMESEKRVLEKMCEQQQSV